MLQKNTEAVPAARGASIGGTVGTYAVAGALLGLVFAKAPPHLHDMANIVAYKAVGLVEFAVLGAIIGVIVGFIRRRAKGPPDGAAAATSQAPAALDRKGLAGILAAIPPAERKWLPLLALILAVAAIMGLSEFIATLK